MEMSRQEYCGGLPFPPPGDLPNPGIKPKCPASPALADGLFTWEGSELSHQGLNSDHSSECLKSQPLNHQGTLLFALEHGLS